MAPGSPEDPYLDAARDTILAVGWRRTTLTAVAKRAGVSRMTIYRTWPDMSALLGDLLVREWGGILDTAMNGPDLVGGIVAAAASLRDDPLLARIREVDPEVLLPYLLHRRGRNQDQVLRLLTDAIRHGQTTGRVRPGDPDLLARTLLLTLHGFVLSTGTLPETPLADLDRELTLLIERYLAP